MTVHVPVIANPNIAVVTRLASLPPIIIHSLLSLTPLRQDLHVTGLCHQVFPLTCAPWYCPP